MGGIFGVLRHNQSPVTPEHLKRMAGPLGARGEPVRSLWHDEHVGVGACARDACPPGLATSTRSDLSLPTAVVDARIDNRSELGSLLGFLPGERRLASDAHLVLAAYERWGADFVDQIVGDFAVAIWDPRTRELVCARDPFGVRSFYYYASAANFIFASEIGPILCEPTVHRRLNEWRIAELVTETFEDDEATIYKDILRLPPGHTLIAGKGRVNLRQYWSPDDAPDIRYRSDLEYDEAFRSLFREAVLCRLDNKGASGATLSGGLDSSAIVCMAQEIRRQRGNGPIKTFSAVYPEHPACDEQYFIESVIETQRTEAFTVRPASFNPLAELEGETLGLDEPLYWPTWCMEYPLFDAARSRGVHVLLTGHGGDHVLAKTTTGYYTDLLRSGRWAAAMKEARRGAHNYETSTWRFGWQEFVKPLLRSTLPTPVRTARRRLSNVPNTKAQRLNPSFATRVDFTGRWQDIVSRRQRHESTARSYHAHLLTHPATRYGLELVDLVGTRFGFRITHPFWDRRLVEFCIGIPREQLFLEGTTGVVLRRALFELLPEEVATRNTKAYFNPVVIHTLREYNHELFGRLIQDAATIADWIDLRAFQDAHDRFFGHGGVHEYESVQSRDAGFLIAGATLMLWLKRAGSL